MKTINRIRLGVLWVAATIGILMAGPLPVLGQFTYQRLRTFGFIESTVTQPEGNLVEGTNGAFYGVSAGGGETENGTLYRLNKDGSGLAILRSFSGTNGDGTSPYGGLCLAKNGSLYGTTWSGGYSNLGTVFRIDQDGNNYAALRSFTGYGGDGASPAGGLVQATNGLLYGMTYGGGGHGLGTVFSMHLDGSGYQVLKRFAGGNGDGAQPWGALVQGANGMLYGTSALGGGNNLGTVFTLNLDGTGYQVLRSFTGAPGDGAKPYARVTQGSDGVLYGTTDAGGAANAGTVFRIKPDGTDYSVIHQFANSEGADPFSPLIFGSNGALYGATQMGGPYSNGTIFRINPDGSGYSALKTYQADGEDGAEPAGALVQGSDGELYGTTFMGGGMGCLGTAFRLDLDGVVYKIVRRFSQTGDDGCNPQDALVRASNGCLYGTTQNGGACDQGTVFKMNVDGTGYTVLHSFTGTNGSRLTADGALPVAGLIQATNGALYGTTTVDFEYQMISQGNTYTLSLAGGTIFKLNPDGTGYQVLTNFAAENNGPSPYGALVQATNGKLYGTTFRGGSRSLGTVFRIDLDGTGFAVLKSFGATDGAEPQAGLVQGIDGRLYGTTQSGGVGSGGTVFALNLDGGGFQVLKRFLGSDGSSPQAALVQGVDGALYGTTLGGGSNGLGTVFRLNPDGSGFAVLKHFMGQDGDGASPKAALVQGKDGRLYGTTTGGGANPPGCGTVFRLNTNGTDYVVLRNFIQDFCDGISPAAGLVQTSDGTLYGTTSAGGRDQNGTLYALIPPTVMLPPTPGVNGCRISLTGLSGRTYTIQRSTSVSGPWVGLGTAAAGPTGAGAVFDTNPPAGTAFYRAAYP
jgi:uncharacterized repeat protein (TIGR03803 family)